MSALSVPAWPWLVAPTLRRMRTAREEDVRERPADGRSSLDKSFRRPLAGVAVTV